jgi:hypothetical protein
MATRVAAGAAALLRPAEVHGKYKLTQTDSNTGAPVLDRGMAASTTVARCSEKTAPPPKFGTAAVVDWWLLP